MLKNMLKQHGGEGKAAYKGKSNDSRLPQHGGEGSSLSKKTDQRLLGKEDWKSPGRTVGKSA